MTRHIKGKVSPVDSEIGLDALGPRELSEDDVAFPLLDGLRRDRVAPQQGQRIGHFL